MQHIRDRLPDIKARLNTLMGQTQQELASYGDMHFSGKEHRVALSLHLLETRNLTGTGFLNTPTHDTLCKLLHLIH